MKRIRRLVNAPVAQPTSKFKNVVFCEDIRNEEGNKKSLMGVSGGDLHVATFPATIPVAVYCEYLADKTDGDKLSIKFRLMQDDTEAAVGGLEADISKNKQGIFVLPKGFLVFDKPATFKLFASVNGGPEEELLTKQIMLPRSDADSTSLQRLASLLGPADPSTKP